MFNGSMRGFQPLRLGSNPCARSCRCGPTARHFCGMEVMRVQFPPAALKCGRISIGRIQACHACDVGLIPTVRCKLAGVAQFGRALVL